MTEKKQAGSADVKTVSREFRVRNQYGIHARPAALLVKTATAFKSDVTIQKAGAQVSAKSIMGLLTIEGHQNSVLKITACGEDAEAALDAIAELFDKQFYEE